MEGTLGQKIAPKFGDLIRHLQQRFRHFWPGEDNVNLGGAMAQKGDHLIGGD
jgi:hypothetical protein